MVEPSAAKLEGAGADGQRAARLRRWVGGSGLLLAGFVVVHLCALPLLLAGGRRAGSWLTGFHGSRWLALLELCLLWLPLCVHALGGVGRAVVGPRLELRDATAVLRRGAALASLAFVGWHLWQYRVAVALGRLDGDDVYWALAASLSSTTRSGVPLVAAGYVIGLAATTYHLAVGLRRIWEDSGRLAHDRARRLADVLCTALGFVLFVSGMLAVIYLATGSRLVGVSPHDFGDRVSSVIMSAACLVAIS